MDLRYFDISPPISEATAVFPGDVSFKRSVGMSFEDGQHLALSSISTTLHVGAHVDSPSHYAADGKTMEAQPLHYYLGPCQVVTVDSKGGGRIYPEDVNVEITQPRVLFRTLSFPDPESWTGDFTSLSPELIVWLKEKRVVTVGIDTPSVDPWDSKNLESHAALNKCAMANLEGLVLNDVPDGSFWLIALPLKIEGADGSPVRAILIKEDFEWRK